MESSVDEVGDLKGIIKDTAICIKNNDSAFGITTLPNVIDKILDLMNRYGETVKRIEACRSASEYFEAQEEIEANDNAGDIMELEVYSELIRQKIEEEKVRLGLGGQFPALSELELILRPPEEEIQLAQAPRHIPKDPITKRDIEYAVRSTVCGHVYDKDGIEEYFRQRSNKTHIRCPQAGCTNVNMKRNELVPDEETNNLIQSIRR